MLKLTSIAFNNGGTIPARYARPGVPGGQNVSVPLDWTGDPDTTESFALVSVDRNPAANNWIHWAVVDIPAAVSSIPEGVSPRAVNAIELKNTFGNSRYDGPQPPNGTGVHAYEFTVYALNVKTIKMPDRPTATEFEHAVAPFVLESAKLTGNMESK